MPDFLSLSRESAPLGKIVRVTIIKLVLPYSLLPNSLLPYLLSTLLPYLSSTPASNHVRSGSGYKINVGGWAQVVSFILIGILMVMSTRAFMVTVSSVYAHRHEPPPRRTPRPPPRRTPQPPPRRTPRSPPLPPPHRHHQYLHHHRIHAHHQVRSVWQSRRSSTGIGGMLSIHGGIMAPLTTQLMGMVRLLLHAPSAKPACPRSLNQPPPRSLPVPLPLPLTLPLTLHSTCCPRSCSCAPTSRVSIATR